jgi:putative ABC transport system substrate-binding protein
MRRREFIAGLGGAAAWTVAARGQQLAMPVIGFLNSTSPDFFADGLRGFHLGLKSTGYVEGENVAIEYRWAENQLDRLPALAADLLRRGAAVIVAGTADTASVVKKATTTVPILFIAAEDPVRLGLVASLGRPGGNLTGVNFFAVELAAKRLELLRELVPSATHVAVLVSPANATVTEATVRDVQAATRDSGVQIQVLNANDSREIDAAFETFVRERPDAVFVGTGPFFTSRRVQLAHLATRHAVAAIYGGRQFADVGGLMSYGASLTEAFRQVGVYAGRILKGAKAEDMPVVQSSKFELVINAQTARTLGITVPPTLLARADEVIE